MARPHKEGLDFWQAEIGMFEDDKFVLALAKHGDAAISVIVRLLNSLYRVGYCYRWTEKDQLIFASKGTTPLDRVQAIVQTLIEDGFFDQGMFERFAILTSKGIQRRYLRWLRERTNVTMKREHLLVDASNYNNINVLSSDNPGYSSGNPSFSAQSRGEESRVDKRRVEEKALARVTSTTWNKFLPGIEPGNEIYNELLKFCLGDVAYLERNLLKAAGMVEKRGRGPNKNPLQYMRIWLEREVNEYGRAPIPPKPEIVPINKNSAPDVETAAKVVLELRKLGRKKFAAGICEQHEAIAHLVRELGVARFFTAGVGALEACMDTFRDRYEAFLNSPEVEA